MRVLDPTPPAPPPVRRLRILFLNWRDTRHPEGGGSEVYVESVARSLAASGHEVTLFCARYEGSDHHEEADGIRFVRAGTKLTVYAEALRRLRRGAFGELDVIVDVQNGIPFLSRLVSGGTPVVVLVHHVHREQWPVVYGPVRSRVGWWIESALAPRVYRESLYVTVSDASRQELELLGVDNDRITVIHNGIEDAPGLDVKRSEEPHIVVVGRLVPHKRIEHVLQAAAILRRRHAGLRVSIVGDGWWGDQLQRAAQAFGVTDIVDFCGFVDEKSKHELLASAWVLALPSLKEGWGIVIMEAATHGVPAVAYRNAGGVAESIEDGSTGLLVDGGVTEFASALDRLLTEEELRLASGRRARDRSQEFSWQSTAVAFAECLGRATGAAAAPAVAPTPSRHVLHPEPEAAAHPGTPGTGPAR